MTTLAFAGVCAGIVALASAITAAIVGDCKIEKKWQKQLIAFAITELLCFGAYWIKWLPAYGEPWWLVLLGEGLLLSLASMGLYSIDVIAKIWELLFHEPMTKIVKIEEDIPTGNRPVDKVMKFQNELAPFIKNEGDKITIKVVK